MEIAVQPITTKPGNSNKTDLLTLAKAQYEVGRLVLVSDELESQFMKWQSRSENISRYLQSITGWPGQLVHYFMGLVDFGLALVAVEHFDLINQLQSENVRHWLRWLTRSY